MTSYKIDTSFRMLANSSDFQLIVRAWQAIDPSITEAEAIRRTVQKFFEDKVLPTVKSVSITAFGQEVSVFDNVITKVSLD